MGFFGGGNNIGAPVPGSTPYEVLSVDGSGNLSQITYGAPGTVLTGAGASTAPSFQAPAPQGVSVGDAIGSSTDYNVLSVDGSGDLSQISPSTSGYVLTSNGTGAAPTFQAASGGVDTTPWIVDVDPYMSASGQSHFDSLYYASATSVNFPGIGPGNVSNSDSLMPYNICLQSDGTQNAYVTYNVVLGAGTWNLGLMYYGWAGSGIYTITLDGTPLASLGASSSTIDSYYSPATHGATQQITGIVVPTTGKHVLTLTVASKNSSSSGYGAGIHHISFVRTL
jgi:hypothetical protein